MDDFSFWGKSTEAQLYNFLTCVGIACEKNGFGRSGHFAEGAMGSGNFGFCWAAAQHIGDAVIIQSEGSESRWRQEKIDF